MSINKIDYRLKFEKLQAKLIDMLASGDEHTKEIAIIINEMLKDIEKDMKGGEYFD